MSEVIASFKIKPVYTVEGNAPLGEWTLRRFQERILDNISSKKDTLLVAPTGAGKTLSLFLGKEGIVGLYPNNTLLLDQQRSVDKILRQALSAKLVSPTGGRDVDILRIYELKEGVKLPQSSSSKVAVVLLSGRYIGYERDEEGRLIPKRLTLIKKVVEKICYPAKGEKPPYMIVMGTPDTALMIMAGIYRNFEKVGYALHNAFIASVMGKDVSWILSKYRVAVAGEMSHIARIRECLLKYPWFIDEFHLYGLYEASGLLPILHVYRDYIGWEEPIVLSSATPKGALYERIINEIKFYKIGAEIKTKGSPDALVRGETEVEVVAIDVSGRGVSKWFKIGFYAPSIVNERINKIKKVLATGGNVFIVVDRINQVPPIVDALLSRNIQPECSVTIKPLGCADSEKPIVVGCESISQGIDRENVRYGIITSYNWASLIQRMGRIGRKTESRILILLPRLRKEHPIESLDGKLVTYNEFVKVVMETYRDIDPARKQMITRIMKIYGMRSKLLEYTTIIAYSQVSKPKGVFKTLRKRLREDINILNKFYGSAETLANIMMFRSSGFRVKVEKPDGKWDETDIGTVLRNYDVIDVSIDGKSLKSLVLRIDLTPARYKLVLRPSPKVREDLLRYFSGMITTLGNLTDLGYFIEIRSWDEGNRIRITNIPIEVREQTVALLDLPREFVDYYVYTGNGAEVWVGENKMLALFL